MKLLQKSINFFTPCPFDLIFAVRNDEKNTIHIMPDLWLSRCCIAR